MSTNILLINCVYPPLGGGAGVVVRNNALELKKSGLNVLILSGGQEKKELIKDGLSVHLVPSFPFANPNNSSEYNNPKFEKYFSSIIRSNQIQVAHFHAIQGLGANLVKLSLSLGIKTIVTMHDLWWICPYLFTNDEYHRPTILKNHHLFCSEELSPLYLKKRSRFLKSVLAHSRLYIITVSKTMKDAIEYAIPDLKGKVVVIRNPVPKLRPTAVSINNSDKFIFSYFGKSNPSKGFHLLIQAGLILSKIRSDFQVNMYGLNDLKWIRLNPLMRIRYPWLKIYNSLSENRIGNAIDECNCVIIPSIVPESFSLIAYESLQMNKVIITSNVGALSEIDDSRHFQFISGSPVHLAQKMSSVINDRKSMSHIQSANKYNYYRSQISELINLYEK